MTYEVGRSWALIFGLPLRPRDTLRLSRAFSPSPFFSGGKTTTEKLEMHILSRVQVIVEFFLAVDQLL